MGLALEPDNANLLYNRANAYKDDGDAPRALKAMRDLLKLKPDMVSAWNGLGTILHDMAKLKEAVKAYRRAVEIDPTVGDPWSNLGNVLSDMGQLDKALVAAKRALATNPKDFRFLNNVGLLHRKLNQGKQAVEMYERAAELAGSSDRSPWFNLGNMYKEEKELEKARRAYKRALEIDPASAATMMAMGGIFYEMRDNQKAMHWYKKAVETAPEDPEIQFNVGNNFKEMSEYQEAIAYYYEAERLILEPAAGTPANNVVRNRMYLLPRVRYERFFSKNFVCDWDGREEEFAQLREHVAASVAEGADPELPRIVPFQAINYPLSGPELLAAARKFARVETDTMTNRLRDGLMAPLPVPTAPLPGGRLRIGYVSADFGNHPVAEDMMSVYPLHDRTRFEVYAYSLHEENPYASGLAGDRRMGGKDYNKRIRDSVDEYVVLEGMGNVEAAERISSDGIHVLVDLNGYTRGQRLAIFAARPAAIQIGYKGYAGTTGADFMDFIVLDRIVAPPHLQRQQFSERVVNLPDQFFVNDFSRAPDFQSLLEAESRRKPRSAYGLPEGKVLLCNFNKLFKVDPTVFGLWVRILEQAPESVLWLLNFPPEGAESIRSRGVEAGIDEGRFVLMDLLPKNEHLLAKSHCDLFLDTLQYNAHGTAAEAMWAGVPVLTMPGNKYTSRVAASLTTAANVTDTIVYSTDEYVARTVELANGLAEHGQDSELAAIQTKLRDSRTTSPLFDTEKWVRSFEAALQAMWETKAAGLKPNINI